MNKIKCVLATAIAGLGVLCFAACEEEHEHSFSEDWKFNESQHWHEAVCEHTDEVSGKSGHDLLNGKCTVCGYEVPVTEISSADWKSAFEASANADSLSYELTQKLKEDETILFGHYKGQLDFVNNVIFFEWLESEVNNKYEYRYTIWNEDDLSYIMYDHYWSNMYEQPDGTYDSGAFRYVDRVNKTICNSMEELEDYLETDKLFAEMDFFGAKWGAEAGDLNKLCDLYDCFTYDKATDTYSATLYYHSGGGAEEAPAEPAAYSAKRNIRAFQMQVTVSFENGKVGCAVIADEEVVTTLKIDKYNETNVTLPPEVINSIG